MSWSRWGPAYFFIHVSINVLCFWTLERTCQLNVMQACSFYDWLLAIQRSEVSHRLCERPHTTCHHGEAPLPAELQAQLSASNGSPMGIPDQHVPSSCYPALTHSLEPQLVMRAPGLRCQSEPVTEQRCDAVDRGLGRAAGCLRPALPMRQQLAHGGCLHLADTPERPSHPGGAVACLQREGQHERSQPPPLADAGVSP